MSSQAPADQPPFVRELAAIFGPESQAGFGGAVFWRPLPEGVALEDLALEIYRHFVGASWARFGEAAWLGAWRRVYVRPQGAGRDLARELGGMEDAEGRRAVTLVLEPGGDPERTHAALAAGFDAEEVSRLEVHHVGDGAAMSGLLVIAARPGHALALIALLD